MTREGDDLLLRHANGVEHAEGGVVQANDAAGLRHRAWGGFVEVHVGEPGLVKEQAKHWSGDGSADDRDGQPVIHAGAGHAAQPEANRVPGRLGGGELYAGVCWLVGRTGWRRRVVA